MGVTRTDTVDGLYATDVVNVWGTAAPMATSLTGTYWTAVGNAVYWHTLVPQA